MQTLHFELEVEDNIAKLYQQISEEIKLQFKQKLKLWIQQYLQTLLAIPPSKSPWLEFLDNIDRYAIDTGIEDFSIQHDHYLYGLPKKVLLSC